MTNPLFDALDGHFRGERVRVVGNDGTTYEGWAERLHHHDRHVLLRDAVNVDRDDDIGTAYVAHCDSIEILETDSRIEQIHLDAIKPAPYAAQKFDREGNCGYIARVRNDGWAGSFPVVRPVDDAGFEVVEGHKRLWVAEQAGLTTHPVEIVDVDDWVLAWRFVVDHLPDEEQIHDNGTTKGCYDDAQVETVIGRLTDEWGDRAFDLPRVRFNADRLGFDVGGDVTDQEGEPGDMADDTGDEATDADVEAAVDDDEELPDGEDTLTDSDEDTDDSVDDYSLPPTGEEVLDALNEHGELSSAELKHITQRSLQAISTNLNDLEEMGRVESRPDPDDGRRQLYSLSDESERDEHRVGDPIDEDSAGAQEAEADGGVTAESSDDLPPGVTAQDIRDAVEAVEGRQREGLSYLGDVADELNVREPRARLFCHTVGVYDKVTDASGYRGET